MTKFMLMLVMAKPNFDDVIVVDSREAYFLSDFRLF